MALALWFTVQIFANSFKKPSQQTRLLDGIHNAYYEEVKKQFDLSTGDIEAIRDFFNDRYRSYDTLLPFSKDKNHPLELVRQFLRHLDTHHGTDYENDTREVVGTTEIVVSFLEGIRNATQELREHYGI